MWTPPLSPPGWLFPVVWSILFALMGIASYLVLQAPDSHLKPISGIVYGLQLLFNFFWSILFFNWQLYWFSLVWLAVLELLKSKRVTMDDQTQELTFHRKVERPE